MAIVTLTSDLGLKDYYVSAVKGALYSQLPDIRIVDITHDIAKFNILEAAFALKNAYYAFPKGSIHIIGVQAELNEYTCHVVVEHNDHFFIAADNGVFSLLFDQNPDRVFELSIKHDSNTTTFPIRDVFVKAAAHLARGGTPEVIGIQKTELLIKSEYQVFVEENAIKGSVVYVDSYGNAITNITLDIFKQVGRGREFAIGAKVKGYDITALSTNYGNVPAGERLGLFGVTGYLEIAINFGSATNLLGLKLHDMVRIEFIG
ncbi:MAG: SAM-dependent chlorinase/fluorinase [Flavobacteriales bacterium]|nr:SAM-dependent chlorinase/fluorinase [Flavobacteriales bacterium]